MKILLLFLVMLGVAMMGHCGEDHNIGDGSCSEKCSDLEHCDEREKKCKCGNGESCIDTEKPMCKNGSCQSCDTPNILCNLRGHKICVLSEFRCDGDFDCEDGEDEKHCVHEGTEKGCFGLQFKCEDNRNCIDQANVCDGKEHCPDGSDEMTQGCEETPVGTGNPLATNEPDMSGGVGSGYGGIRLISVV